MIFKMEKLPNEVTEEILFRMVEDWLEAMCKGSVEWSHTSNIKLHLVPGERWRGMTMKGLGKVISTITEESGYCLMLKVAAREGMIDVFYLASKAKNSYLLDENIEIALFYAAINEHADLCSYLVSGRNISGRAKSSIMKDCLRYGCTKSVKVLLQNDFPAWVIPKTLHCGTQEVMENLKMLQDCEQDLRDEYPRGEQGNPDCFGPSYTWLHVAADFGNLAVVQFLLDQGCNVDGRQEARWATEPRAWTPLSIACAQRNVAVVQLLLENHALLDNCFWPQPPEQHLPESAVPALDIVGINVAGLRWAEDHWSGERKGFFPKMKKITEMLMEHGSQPTFTDHDKGTLYQVVSEICGPCDEEQSRQNDMKLRFVVELGVDVNDCGSNDFEPLAIACLYYSRPLVQLMLEKGANIKHPKSSLPPALCACRRTSCNENKLQYIRLLKHAETIRVRSGANPPSYEWDQVNQDFPPIWNASQDRELKTLAKSLVEPRAYHYIDEAIEGQGDYIELFNLQHMEAWDDIRHDQAVRHHTILTLLGADHVHNRHRLNDDVKLPTGNLTIKNCLLNLIERYMLLKGTRLVPKRAVQKCAHLCFTTEERYKLLHFFIRGWLESSESVIYAVDISLGQNQEAEAPGKLRDLVTNDSLHYDDWNIDDSGELGDANHFTSNYLSWDRKRRIRDILTTSFGDYRFWNKIYRETTALDGDLLDCIVVLVYQYMFLKGTDVIPETSVTNLGWRIWKDDDSEIAQRSMRMWLKSSKSVLETVDALDIEL
ncbi:MAG: hypothetical protein Q9217_001783 [Psora testacea]